MPDKVIHILHVDDIEEEFILVNKLLSDIDGVKFDIQWAPDAASAQQALRRASFDLCLIDYYLGKDNGLEFARSAIAGGVVIPFILMSGQGNSAINQEAMKIGVRQCLNKNDLTTSLLVNAISSTLQNS